MMNSFKEKNEALKELEIKLYFRLLIGVMHLMWGKPV